MNIGNFAYQAEMFPRKLGKKCTESNLAAGNENWNSQQTDMDLHCTL